MAEQGEHPVISGRPESGWVNRLSHVILFGMMLYAVIGIPEFDRKSAVAMATDHVSPLNRFIWLTLLALALPVMKEKWRSIMGLFKASWPLMGLFLYFTCSTQWALDPAVSLRRVMFAWVEIVLAATVVCGLKGSVAILRAVAFSCVVAAFADLLVWIVMPGYAMTDEGLAGLQLQKNQTGIIMLYGLLAVGALLPFVKRRVWRWAGAGSLVLLFVLLLASRSKTCLGIVLCVPGLVWLIGQLGRRRFSVGLAFVATVCALSGVGSFVYLVWCMAMNADPLAPFRDMTFTSRTDLWAFMFDEISARPWLGAGFSSFWSIDPAVQPSLKTSMWFGSEAHINEAHNGYLDLLATGGLIGFLWGVGVLAWAVALGCRAFVRSAKVQGRGVGVLALPSALFHLAFLLSLCIHNFTESNLFSNNALLAVALYYSIFSLENWRRNLPARASAPWAGARLEADNTSTIQAEEEPAPERHQEPRRFLPVPRSL